MADPKIKLKRSAVAGKIPTPDQLPLGEVALNTYDGYLYASKNVGVGTTVIAVNPFRVGTGTDTYNVYFTAGDVGIGTITPTQKLHVEGNALVNGNLYLNDTNYLSSLPTGDYGSVQVNGDGKGNWEGYSIDGHAVFMSNGPNSSFGLFDDTNNHWAILHSRGNNSYTEIRGGNNSANLSVYGTDVRVENVPLIVNRTTLTGTASQNLQIDGGGYFSGDVGIGTTNPDFPLHVFNSEQNNVALFESGDPFAQFGLSDSNGSVSFLTTLGNLKIKTGGDAGTVGTNGIDSLFIKSTGEVGIGTDLPGAKLDVNGDVSIASTVSIGTTIDIIPYNDLGALSFEGSAGQLFSITNDLTSGSIFSVNDVSGIPSIDVDADGTIQLAPYGSTEYVGIGTTNPTQKLDVVGTVKATSFTGDGSGLTNVTAVGTGVGIQSNTTVVGTAQTINFGTNLSATLSDGVATITATSGGGGSTGTATTITLADESTDTECFLIFATDATGDQEPKTGSNLTFNSNTGALTATSFVKESNSGGFLKADGTEDTNTYLTSYTETQTLDDVLGLGNTSSTGLSVGVATATSFVKSGGTSSQFLKADGSVDSSTYLTSYTESQTLDDVLGLGNTSSTGLSVGVATATSFVKSGGTSSQFLKADGSVDSNTYLTSYTETQTLDDVLGLGNISGIGLSVGVITATSLVKSDGTSSQFLKADGSVDSNTYLTSYTETQALDDVVGLGSDTTQTITVGTATTGIILRPDGTLNVSGVSTFSGDVSFGSTATFGDNDKLKFGDGQDLQIYHDSVFNNSIIVEYGGGNLLLGGTNIDFRNTLLQKSYAKFIANGAVELYYDDSKKFETTGIGVSILNGVGLTATIAGPSNLIIDPGTVGDNTGIVRIKGDLFVDGTTTQINSTTLEIADFIVGVATTATSDLLTDGAGIGIGSDKTFLYEHNSGTNSSLKSSENLNVASGKGYQIDQIEVLSANTLSLGTGATIHSPASNRLIFGTNGQERVRINASGKVGIGSDTPTQELHVEGNALVNGNLYLNDTNYLSSLPTGNYGSVQINGSGVNNWEGYSIDGLSVFMDNGTSNFGLYDDVNNHWAIRHLRNASSSYTELFGGNNSVNLSVRGTDVRVENVPLIGGGRTTLTGTASQNLQFDGGGYFSGNLGVGNTNPEKPLHVKTSVATPVIVERTAANNTAIEYRNSTSSMWAGMGGNAEGWGVANAADVGSDAYILVTRTDGELLINSTSSTGTASQKLQVTSGAYVSGDVGIGTTNPTSKLDVRGSLNVTGVSTFSDDLTLSKSGNPSLTVATSNNSGQDALIKIRGARTLSSTSDIAMLQFDNKTSSAYTMAQISAMDPAADHLDGKGKLVFRTATGGTLSDQVTIMDSGDVGIGTDTPAYKLEVNGSFAATTKSFIIDHPTKNGMKLRYGSLEGPENGVYVRGRLKGNNTIELPEHWTGLVDEDSITVNLTPIGRKAILHSVVDIVDNTVVVESTNDVVDCFYTVFGERKDVEKLEVEF